MALTFESDCKPKSINKHDIQVLIDHNNMYLDILRDDQVKFNSVEDVTGFIESMNEILKTYL